MILSRSSQYGLELIIHLAHQDQEKFIPLNEVAEIKGLSFYFLSKVTQSLVKQGILNSYRGPNGGVVLAVPPDQLSLYDIVSAIDGDNLFKKCILRIEQCDGENPCPMHPAWEGVSTQIEHVFKNTTMDQINEDQLKKVLA